jgi:hypothetical protein
MGYKGRVLGFTPPRRAWARLRRSRMIKMQAQKAMMTPIMAETMIARRVSSAMLFRGFEPADCVVIGIGEFVISVFVNDEVLVVVADDLVVGDIDVVGGQSVDSNGSHGLDEYGGGTQFILLS